MLFEDLLLISWLAEQEPWKQGWSDIITYISAAFLR